MLKHYMINQNMTVNEAVNSIELDKDKILCIVDENRKLLGIFTSGDLRRYALKDGNMMEKIGNVMNTNPIVFYSEEEVRESMDKCKLVAYPIVDEEGTLLNIIFPESENILSNALEEIDLVIMAGGKGTRLYPYTKILPKALIPIGDYTISERIINNFSKYGCKKIHFVLNYKANMIKAYFDDLKKNYETNYVEEHVFLGTGGGLCLLKNHLHNTFIVSNCDIIVNTDFECALKIHREKGNLITFICAMKNVTIPYGVIKTDEEGQIKEISEKPELSFMTNTGIYIVEPSVLELIEQNEFIHLPDIAKRCMEKGNKVGVFPVSEKAWLDMGQVSEMEKMIKVFSE